MLRERWPPWKVGLYDLEVVSPQEHYFWTSRLAYDTKLRLQLRQKLENRIENCTIGKA